MRRKIRILKGIGKNAFVQTMIGRLLYWYVWLVYKTSRWSMDGLRDEYVSGDFSYFITFWHGRSMSDMFLVLDRKLQKKVFVLISLHRSAAYTPASCGCCLTSVPGWTFQTEW